MNKKTEKIKIFSFTNIFCIGISLLLINFFINYSIFGSKNGKFNKLFKFKDFEGNSCGNGELKDYPYLYIKGSHDSTVEKFYCIDNCKNIIVNKTKCPDRYKKLCDETISFNFSHTKVFDKVCITNFLINSYFNLEDFYLIDWKKYSLYLIWISLFMINLLYTNIFNYFFNKNLKKIIYGILILLLIIISIIGLLLNYIEKIKFWKDNYYYKLILDEYKTIGSEDMFIIKIIIGSFIILNFFLLILTRILKKSINNFIELVITPININTFNILKNILFYMLFIVIITITVYNSYNILLILSFSKDYVKFNKYVDIWVPNNKLLLFLSFLIFIKINFFIFCWNNYISFTVKKELKFIVNFFSHTYNSFSFNIFISGIITANILNTFINIIKLYNKNNLQIYTIIFFYFNSFWLMVWFLVNILILKYEYKKNIFISMVYFIKFALYNFKKLFSIYFYYAFYKIFYYFFNFGLIFLSLFIYNFNDKLNNRIDGGFIISISLLNKIVYDFYNDFNIILASIIRITNDYYKDTIQIN